MAKLVVSFDGNIVHQHFLDDESVGIGRDAVSTIHLDHPTISRQHARIVVVGEDHIIEDLGGSNGTLVNGVRITRRILQHRDIIECGVFHLCYLNSRIAAEVELDRTMLIAALPVGPEMVAGVSGVESAAIPARRPLKVRFPNAYARPLTGTGAGRKVMLDRVVTTFGKTGEAVVVITRRPGGFFLSLVEGESPVRINGRVIADFPHALQGGDEIAVAGQLIEFVPVAGDQNQAA